MNVLYIADPNSTHDQKWVSTLSKLGVKPLWMPRKWHVSQNQEDGWVGYLRDFSVVRLPFTLWQALKLKRTIVKHKIDIVHIMYAEPNALWCNFRSFLKVPMLITCRGTDVLKTIPATFQKKTLINYWVAPLYKRAFLKADAVTATSYKQIREVEKFTEGRVTPSLIRTGVAVSQLMAKANAGLPFSDSSPYILFPRYIKPLYHHEFALEAVKQLSLDIKSRFKMVFIGKDAGDLHYQAQLTEIMDSMIDVRLDFLPKQSQESIYHLYKGAALVVMTPLSDGSPVSAMEAYCCGVPVILPPLAYDEDIFDSSFYRFASWQPKELAITIEQVLLKKEKNTLDEKKLELMDLESNMKKVLSIYLQNSVAKSAISDQ